MARPMALALVVSSAAAADITCPPPGFSSVSNFDLDAFISKPWNVQQAMEVRYLPIDRFQCVRAEYERKDRRSFWGYEISVNNFAQGERAELCAKIVDATAGQLKVAPCFIPPLFAGPYWVIAYNEEEGYALISGGPPKNVGEGGCMTGSGTNNAGLFIFTRQQARDEALVQRVRGIAEDKGFDVSALNDVDQSHCKI